MKEYKYAVFIGRFQPLHKAHVEVIKHGLSIAEKLIIVVGSEGAAPDIRNPFSFEDRKEMILDSFRDDNPLGIDGARNIEIVSVRDYFYSENTWIADIQSKTDQFIKDGDSVALLGSYKDGSSYYLKYFPQWDFVPLKTAINMDATTVREFLFSKKPALAWGDSEETVSNPPNIASLKEKVPDGVYNYLKKFIKTRQYAELCQEHEFIQGYKKQWSAAPYPPTFVTADAVVVCSGHVLVVKRKFSPGKGLYALPGGFVKQNEVLQEGALRELKEETGIKVDKLILSASIVDSKVFDYPGRSLRGRTITHAYYIKLKDGRLPEIRANDDAEEVQWLPIIDVMKHENKFFEDHAHIIQYFLTRS